MMTRKVLYLGSNEEGGHVSHTDGVVPAIKSAGWDVHVAQDPEQARRLFDQHRFHVGMAVISSDLDEHPDRYIGDTYRRIEHMEWVALVSQKAKQHKEICRLVASYFFDYHTLPPDLDRLVTVIGHAHGMAELNRAGCAEGAEEDPEMVGVSAPMRAIFRDIRKMGSVDAPILITGESGTGKELAARAIHERSHRTPGPFNAVNCAALPASIIQSELFGYEQGAFTGAKRRKIGHIESASGGVLFLDEVGDLPLDLQVNLLRFLQQSTIQRVGGVSEIPVDVRIIAATNVDLEKAIEEGRFREDLYFRLNVLRLEMPPLRERVEDIELLARFFFKKFANEKNRRVRGFSSEALQSIANHSWPGNVRELINRVRRGLIMCEKRVIEPADLGLARVSSTRCPMTLEHARTTAEREALQLAFRHTGGNLSRAARILGVSRPALYRLIARHRISH